jgi:hypothetical protein
MPIVPNQPTQRTGNIGQVDGLSVIPVVEQQHPSATVGGDVGFKVGFPVQLLVKG